MLNEVLKNDEDENEREENSSRCLKFLKRKRQCCITYIFLVAIFILVLAYVNSFLDLNNINSILESLQLIVNKTIKAN